MLFTFAGRGGAGRVPGRAQQAGRRGVASVVAADAMAGMTDEYEMSRFINETTVVLGLLRWACLLIRCWFAGRRDVQGRHARVVSATGRPLKCNVNIACPVWLLQPAQAPCRALPVRHQHLYPSHFIRCLLWFLSRAFHECRKFCCRFFLLLLLLLSVTEFLIFFF